MYAAIRILDVRVKKVFKKLKVINSRRKAFIEYTVSDGFIPTKLKRSRVLTPFKIYLDSFQIVQPLFCNICNIYILLTQWDDSKE
jgi:hypothetical protein